MYDNLINLVTYIKSGFIKDKFYESCKTIHSVEEAINIANEIITEGIEDYNIIFETSSIKEQFFNTIKILEDHINIINCNSSYNRFCESLQDGGLKIYNNINKCTDINILNEIKNNKGILIC